MAYLTRQARRAAAIDPTLWDRERRDATEHQRKVRVLERLDAAKHRLAVERDQPDTAHKRPLIRALERHDKLTAQAIGLGLIRKEPK